MALTWIQALKKWNEKNENWCVPRKDTEGYNEVMALMRGEMPKKLKKEKEKKEKKNKEKTKKEKTNEQVEPEIKTREVAAEETKDSSKNYLERISAKYEVPEKRIKEADE